MFFAEPPQEPLPYGRWAEALREHFLQAAPAEGDAELGEIAWFPDRTFGSRTYVPGVAPSPEGGEVCGYVSYRRTDQGAQAVDFEADAYYTEDTAEANPDWKLDLSDEELAVWRGPQGRQGVITLVWGVALTANGVVATAELGSITTDQCAIIEDRFTLISLDNYTGDFIEIKLWGAGGREVAAESLYADEDEEDEEGA
jgi:hypothetical protein